MRSPSDCCATALMVVLPKGNRIWPLLAYLLNISREGALTRSTYIPALGRIRPLPRARQGPVPDAPRPRRGAVRAPCGGRAVWLCSCSRGLSQASPLGPCSQGWGRGGLLAPRPVPSACSGGSPCCSGCKVLPRAPLPAEGAILCPERGPPGGKPQQRHL